MKNAEILVQAAGIDDALQDSETAHLVLDVNKVVQSHLVPGLRIETSEEKGGIRAEIRVEDGANIVKRVHLCFGVTQPEAIQRIILNIQIGSEAGIDVLAHCVFPQAVDIEHIMDAEITVGEGSRYSYLESHVHSDDGGLKVLPKARITLGERSRFKTEFQLVRGRVGYMDIDYEAICGEESVLEMLSKISGREDDYIKIREVAFLQGKGARGYLTSRVAVRDRARAEVYNKLVATAAGARGHVDCKEIIKDQGVASAVPVVEVRHPQAHITHEAAIGSVDNKQLETLMSRGLDEDSASDLIIAGLLA
ncbi:MAG: SufD family Fe-S cluster assembly protein [Spirochaetales bacterium]|nr:SufD family Fe-S cluster assembly protein [Spirochaetales bacterium]